MTSTRAENRRRLLRHGAPTGPLLPTTRRALAAVADGDFWWPELMDKALCVEGLHDDCLGTLLAYAVAVTQGRASERSVASLIASICFLVRARHGIAL